jgi:predicted DNA-binding protein
MTIHLNLPPETERRLRERAARRGRTLAAYLEEVVEDLSRAEDEVSGSGPLDSDELERRLEELASGLDALPSLPADFGRADIYGEHP